MAIGGVSKRTEARQPDLTRTVLAGLTTDSERLSLVDLAERVIRAIGRLDGVQRVALVFDRDAAAALAGDWAHRSETCLVQRSGDDHLRWCDRPQNWSEVTAVLGRERLADGPGALPVDDIWPTIPAAAAADDWLAARFQSTDGPLAELALEITGDRGTVTAVADQVSRFQVVLDHLLTSWIELRVLRSGLQRAADENRALGRLGRLQGRLVAMTSHEFKTPLTSIMAYADVLHSRLTGAEFAEASEFLEVIRTEAGRLLRMANRILDFSRLEPGRLMLDLVAQDLRPLVDETLATLRPAIAAKGLTVEVTAEPGLPRAEVDADLIRQVLVNLVSNAVKYIHRGGRISIELVEAPSGILVRVADDGPGIPPQDLKRIFREFFRVGATSSEEGTGLGLTIVRHIINLHGGYVTVANRAVGGAEFDFLVPKELHVLEALPTPLTDGVGPNEALGLLGTLVRLLADLSATGNVTLAFAVDGQPPRPALVLGRPVTLDPACSGQPGGEPAVCGGVLQIGLELADDLRCCLAFLRQEAAATYDASDIEQLRVLGEITRRSLAVLTGPDAEPGRVGKVDEALSTLIRINRNGVPTSTPLALYLIQRLADRLGLDEPDICGLQYVATLHDAGMARIEDEIVQGSGDLSWDERDEVERHVEQGLDLTAPILPAARFVDVIRHHHERFDGSGYPGGLRGEEIPVGARLLAIIDAWFSLTKDRPYRAGLTPAAAMRELQEHAGSQFDPRILDEFRQVLADEDILPNTSAETDPARPTS